MRSLAPPAPLMRERRIAHGRHRVHCAQPRVLNMSRSHRAWDVGTCVHAHSSHQKAGKTCSVARRIVLKYVSLTSGWLPHRRLEFAELFKRRP